MSTIAFTVNAVERVAAARYSNFVSVEADMSPDQMFEALRTFLEHVNQTTWDAWKRRLDDDTPPRTEVLSSDGSAVA